MADPQTIAELGALVAAGHDDWDRLGRVRVTRRDGLVVFDYTDRAGAGRPWTFLERVGRGLVLDGRSRRLVRARTTALVAGPGLPARRRTRNRSVRSRSRPSSPSASAPGSR